MAFLRVQWMPPTLWPRERAVFVADTGLQIRTDADSHAALIAIE
jgi:hypothetical protein